MALNSFSVMKAIMGETIDEKTNLITLIANVAEEEGKDEAKFLRQVVDGFFDSKEPFHREFSRRLERAISGLTGIYMDAGFAVGTLHGSMLDSIDDEEVQGVLAQIKKRAVEYGVSLPRG